MTKEELVKSWFTYRGGTNVTNDQLQAIDWAWEVLRGSCCQMGKNSQMPCKFRAKQLKDGKWIVGWFVMHHIPITDRHDNLKGYEEVPMLFNDDEGERNKGGYWHTIDQTTLEQVPQEQKINFLGL